MTLDQLDLLLDYIDARVAESEARVLSDGGLSERLHAYNLREKVRVAFYPPPTDDPRNDPRPSNDELEEPQ